MIKIILQLSLVPVGTRNIIFSEQMHFLKIALNTVGKVWLYLYLKNFSSFRCNSEKAELATFCSSNMDTTRHLFIQWVHSPYS